jgi:beta-mannosidase
VHTDLMAAGVLSDPYRDGVENEIRWMHGIDWRYSTTLRPDGAFDLTTPRQASAFDGIDTVARVRLGEVELGRSYNMHRSYRYDMTAHLTGQPMCHIASF